MIPLTKCPSSMTERIVALFLFLTILFLPQVASGCLTDVKLSGPYLGQTPPGSTPQLFAPGIISTPAHEFSCSFTPDGKEFYFTRMDPKRRQNLIYVIKSIDGTWTEPEVVPFIQNRMSFEPRVTPDGSRLYFTWDQPVPGQEGFGMNVWYVERTGKGWSDPINPGQFLNPNKAMCISVTLDGTIYTSDISGGPGTEAIASARLVNGEYQKLERLPAPINVGAQDMYPYVAPDESYLIFASRRQSPPSSSGLFVSFKNPDRTWGEPRAIDLGFPAGLPLVSPDGKYLFFTAGERGKSDIYWVEAQFLKERKAAETIPLPVGNSPTIDGTITNEEWKGARRESFSDGSELLLLRNGANLYLGIKSNTPGMIVGNIFLNQADRITIHHASGALGTAIYQKDDKDWRLAKDFSWRCRRLDDGEEARAERDAFFREENWIASNSRMGTPHELEYRIRMPEGPSRLAAHFLRASAPNIKIPWPVDLDDDCVKPTPGGLTQTSRFTPEKWIAVAAAPTDFPLLQGPYLGQKRPGSIPEIFAPGILSLGFHEHNITISPDGKEIFFVAAASDFSRYLIMTTKLKNNAWSMPEVAPFSSGPNDLAPAFSPDGKRLYFSSRRPRTAGGTPGEDFDIWYVERKDDSWTDPANLGGPVNTEQNEVNPSVMSDGTIFFQRIEKLGTLDWDLYLSTPRNGTYGPPEKLPAPINTEANEAGPFIAPDGSYLMFHSNRAGGKGVMDLYVTYRAKDGGWSDPVNLGEKINSPYSDWGPVVSPDGRYLFFSSFRNVQPISSESADYLEYMTSRLGTPSPGKGTLYWMETKTIDALKPKDRDMVP